MRTGQQLDIILSYSSLYKLNPQTARVALLEVYRQTSNISSSARMFQTTRKVVQLAIKKQSDGDLTDRSHAAKTVHNRTSEVITKKAVTIKNSTKFGYRRVAKELRDKQGIQIKDDRYPLN